MLDPNAAARILELVSDDDQLLDVGAGANPFPRADWVIDLMPYAERGVYGLPPDPESERFNADTWVQRDICDREPWPFADGQFAFSLCSHTLEDVRDPVFVCSELIRVSRAGYIEVPSRLEEQSLGVNGPWAGWSHHRWLVDVDERGLTFVFKPGVLHAKFNFPAGFAAALRPEERVQHLFWRERFSYRERIFTAAAELDAYLEEVVTPRLPAPRRRLRSPRARAR
jgi:hypothetical protein